MLKASLADKARHHIKQWIIHYHLKPGSLLNVGVLARSLEMSHTPVREALSMLEREHMIERRPQKGYVVRGLNLQEIEDLYDLRISLEQLAAHQAAKRIQHPERERLAAILEKVGRSLKAPNKPRILDLEQEFHVVIFKASGNRALAEIGCGILDRIWIIQNINLLTTSHLSDAHPQHLQVFEAIASGDSRQAAALMKKHITLAKDFVLSRLKRSDDVLSHWMLGAPLQGPIPVTLRKSDGNASKARRKPPAEGPRKGDRP